MRIISLNLGIPRTIAWKNRTGETGIFKYSVETPIFLRKEGVSGDSVLNRVAHGGVDKACYLFGENNYPFWRNLYPDLEFSWGMFGENITVTDLDESVIRIGDIIKIGDVTIQVSQPRQPCWKQDFRFNSELFSPQFIEQKKCGFYVRILQEGYVSNEYQLELIETNPESLTVQEVFGLLYPDKEKEMLIERALSDKNLAESCKKDIIKKLKKNELQ